MTEEVYDHIVYGRVTILSRYTDFWMASTTGGTKSVYEADLVPVAQAEVLEFPKVTPASIPEQEPKPPDLVKAAINVNTTSASILARTFPLLSKITWRRVKEAQSVLQGGVFSDFDQLSNSIQALVEEPVDLSPIADHIVFRAEDE